MFDEKQEEALISSFFLQKRNGKERKRECCRTVRDRDELSAQERERKKEVHSGVVRREEKRRDSGRERELFSHLGGEGATYSDVRFVKY